MSETAAKADKANTLVLLAGMHRSGTSMIAEALHHCGLAVADDLIPTDPTVNPRGFWEDSKIVGINEELLEALGSQWFDCRPLPDSWLERAKVKELLAKAADHLDEQYSHQPISVAKDPRICRLLPFWRAGAAKAGIRCRLVIVVRAPIAVAQSLLKRDSLPLEYGVRLWVASYRTLFADGADLDPILVDYDHFLQSPEEQLELLSASLGLSADTGAALAQGVADRTLRHNTPGDFGECGLETETMAPAQQLYESLLTGDLAQANKLAAAKPSDALMHTMASSIVALSASSVAIGELHSKALETVDDRDIQLEKLSELYSRAERVVAERDRQITEINAQLDGVGELYGKAEKIIKERDAQLAKRNAEYIELEKLLKHAEQIVQTRDQQLGELSLLLEQLRGSLVGRLALRLNGRTESD